MLTVTNISNRYTSLQIKSRLLLKPDIISYEYITEDIRLYVKFCVRVCIKAFERVHCVPFPNISVQPNLKYPFISSYTHNRRHYVPPHDRILINCVSYHAKKKLHAGDILYTDSGNDDVTLVMFVISRGWTDHLPVTIYTDHFMSPSFSSLSYNRSIDSSMQVSH